MLMMLQPFGLHVPVCGDGALASRSCTSPDAAFGVDDIAGLFTGPVLHFSTSGESALSHLPHSHHQQHHQQQHNQQFNGSYSTNSGTTGAAASDSVPYTSTYGQLSPVGSLSYYGQLSVGDVRDVEPMSPQSPVDSKKPSKSKGLANEDDRKKRRRERNKIAAAKCRSKKKEKTETLAQESQRLEGHNSNLRSQLEAMLGEKQRLVQLINMHRPSCIVHASSTSPGVEPTHHSNAP
ncbi:uncharacterized protein LOC116939547 [Petromyzon marinus]|uniref:Fos-related antigen 1-like n=1 Tax=Petromyzon marinus TaxID=7757 RepID=A0AAJ7SR54_PETMA|nr:fos-related antigen 1-like [Petromyzon marinus]XP_032803965.1 fos-related antigen 1-like [Petromyzon marinus]